jgi:hypothetical protein
MPAHSKTGVKKEKQAANPVKASAATKAKEAAKKATKKASKRPNKENDKSSAATAQQSAKQSQQKNQKTSHQRSASPDIDALKARIKQLEGASINMLSIADIPVCWYTDSPASQRLPKPRASRLRRRSCSPTGQLVKITICRLLWDLAVMTGLTTQYV